jgi:NAD(P)-dependent dehydrogenase (short-subunit alcohol dehydrogenase family)
MPDFQGKVALITGGSSGIGKAAALAFAREGAKVVIAARREAEGGAVVREILEGGGSALFVSTDVTQSSQIHILVKRAVSAFGRLDCAVNNAAAVEEPFALTADFTEEQFDRSIAVNLKSVWLSMREEIRQMLAQQPSGGAIVNTSSVNGLGGVAQASFYAAAKAGIIALTKSAALEYARLGIRINVLVPGAFDTPMLREVMNRAAGGVEEGREAISKAWSERIPAGRIGRPEEAAAAALWLCSDAASYVTGHSLIVDGGLTSPMR